MNRRQFSSIAVAIAALGAMAKSAFSAFDPDGGAAPPEGSPPADTSAAVEPAPQAPAAAGLSTLGTNLSGMEWAGRNVRYGVSCVPNLHIAIPRAADVKYLAVNGFKKNRLPITWELLQPMLHDTRANATSRALIGEPGAFHPGYEAFITQVLDAHAAAGAKCLIDCHNYCRYQDFIYQPDGSVIGLVPSPSPVLRPYTTDPRQVQQRIMATAPGATLTQANFADFWRRVALKWKDHPGFGGYGLMNEPHHLPKPGETVESYQGYGEDLMIWPAFATAAIEAIRAIDPAGPIYLPGNAWGGSMNIEWFNPAWPLKGPAMTNILYDVHTYLDAFNNGGGFDVELELAKNFAVGIGESPITYDTGYQRLKIATDWAAKHGVRLALTETGMPIDDVRWEEAFKRLMNHAVQTGCEVYSWFGGNHWAARNYPINHVPGFHQGRTLEPAMSGPMKAAAGIAGATLYDDGPGWAPAGSAVTITVYARGYLAAPLTVWVNASNGGRLSKTQLTIPAGFNGKDSYTYTSESNRVGTLSYVSDGQLGGQVPPPRRVYSLVDPVAYEATSLRDAAHAILAKYNASKWEMAHGYTDYMLGAPAQPGQEVRAISDSGFGSSFGNAMDMLNWMNTDPGMGNVHVPIMRETGGRKYTDHTQYGTIGFWCKKSVGTEAKPNPVNKTPYNVEDPHFTIALVAVSGVENTGVLFQASKAEDIVCSELGFVNSQPQARWIDRQGEVVTLTAPTRLIPNTANIVSLTSAPGAQQLRVNQVTVATARASFAPAFFEQLMIGFGFLSYYPRDGFGGYIGGVITGKGAPTPAELGVLERYLRSLV